MAAKAKHYEWRISIIRKKGQLLGLVSAPDHEAAIKAAIKEFEIKNPEQQRRLVAQRLRTQRPV
jgi:hypothetical protein